MTSRNREFLTFGAHQKPTVGDSKFSAVQFDHMGWLKCDGRILNKSDFQFLFNVIGYSFGGSGDQFNLPNPSGRVPGAIGMGTDINYSTFTINLGDQIGEYKHTLTIPEMPSHNHTQNTINDDFNNTSGAYPNLSRPSYPAYDGSGSKTWTSTINFTGGDVAHNNVQPTLGMGNMFIYSGLISWGNYPYTSGPSPTAYPTKTPTQSQTYGYPNNIW